MIDSLYCASSYLELRYIEKDGVDFAEGLANRRPYLPEQSGLCEVGSAEEVNRAIATALMGLSSRRLGLLLSGGMDSGVLASYMSGADAYTFRFLGGDFQGEELERAEAIAERNGMHLHYVDIGWETVECLTPNVMRAKGAPVHSIEPQVLQAALQAKADGIECMVIGDAADYVFGGMDKLLAHEWSVGDFRERYCCVKPEEVLIDPFDMSYVYARYRKPDGNIDLLGFYDKVITEESYASYQNAFAAAGLDFIDPYENLVVRGGLDLQRIRAGEPKYLMRELFSLRYPGLPIPEKIPMPRPVDAYFADWAGPRRPEFREDIDMAKYTGNQKWQLWCLESFLDMVDEGDKHSS